MREASGGQRGTRHGAPRRFGCAIGAVLFLVGGPGFFLRLPLMGYVPRFVIVPLAFVASLTQWRFASALYRVVFPTSGDCC